MSGPEELVFQHNMRVNALKFGAEVVIRVINQKNIPYSCGWSLRELGKCFANVHLISDN